MRCNCSLPFSFSSFFWKQLLGEPIDVADLEGIDRLCVQGIQRLRGLSESQFQEWANSIFFETVDSEGHSVDIHKDGHRTKVTFEEIPLYCDLSLQMRLNECSIQVAAICRGFHQIIPSHFLSLVDWRDLERLICGPSHIDVEILKKNTVYSGFSSSSLSVIWFWKVLRSFDEQERRLFLKFVWGRNRLPLSHEWTSKFTLKHGASMSPDSLPHASTCFFYLDLPIYPSYEVLRAKLLYSIVNCVAIDADFTPHSLGSWTE